MILIMFWACNISLDEHLGNVHAWLPLVTTNTISGAIQYCVLLATVTVALSPGNNQEPCFIFAKTATISRHATSKKLLDFNCLCSGFTLFSFEYLLATHTRKSLIGRYKKVSDVFSASEHEKKHHVFCVNTHHHARKLYNS